VIKSHRLEDVLPLGEGSLASKIGHFALGPYRTNEVKSQRSDGEKGAVDKHASSHTGSGVGNHPPTVLELNAALLEYLSWSPAKVVWELLRSWAASWGFFKFDGESIYQVLDTLVENISHAVAEKTRNLLVKGGVSVEKEEILQILGALKSAVVRNIKGYLGIKDTKG
jgi:hypothetical protein